MVTNYTVRKSKKDIRSIWVSDDLWHVINLYVRNTSYPSMSKFFEEGATLLLKEKIGELDQELLVEK